MLHVFRFLVIYSFAVGVAHASVAAAVLPFDGSSWIWGTKTISDDPSRLPAGSVCFRRTFELPAGTTVSSAQIRLSVDNRYTLSINGKHVGGGDEWRQAHQYDIAGFLTPGTNLITVMGENTVAGPAGLLVNMQVVLHKGATVSRISDGHWKACLTAPQGWAQPGFDDADRSAARVVSAYGIEPWFRLGAPPAARAAARTSRAEPPPDFVWPEAIAYLDDDCSLYSGTHKSLNVTVFMARKSKAFPEHDLPSPVKVARKLMLLRPLGPEAKPELLVDAGTGAIGSPSASYDGKSIYVSMALENEAFYHIYRVPADGGTPQRLTDGPFHDIDPVELPDGRIAFCSTRTGRFEEYHSSPSRAVFTMDAKGGNIVPLTHTFIFDNEPEVMADGRILLLRSDNFFDRGKVETMLHAIRPDGTGGQTVFGLDQGPEYGGRLRAFYCGSPAPMPDGRVAYVSNKGIVVGMPGSAATTHQVIGVDASGVAALPDGRLLSAVRARGEKNFRRIAVLDPNESLVNAVTIFESSSSYLHSPIFLGARTRPPVLINHVDSRKANDDTADTGFLYCRDVRFTANTTAGWPHVKAIRVLASDGLTLRSSHSYIVHAGSEVRELGTVPIAPDGSFSVEVPADTAIAFQAVDAEGRSELNEMSWITVRPGERRGCLGCHPKRDVAPGGTGASMDAMRTRAVKLFGAGNPHVFRGNNAAVTGLMELQFDRFREVAGINRHGQTESHDASGKHEVAQLVAHLKGSDAGLKISSAQRLAIFRDPAAAPALRACLADVNREVRLAAVMALATCGTRDSVNPLLAALSDRDPVVAQGVSVALENLTGHSVAFNPFVPPNERGAEERKWRDWFNATPFDAIEKGLIERLDGTDRDDLRRAAVALRHIGADASQQALSAALVRERDNNPYPEWRQKHKGDNARFNSLSPANPRALQAVARSLGAFKDSETVAVLASTLEMHRDPMSGNLFLAEAAVEALGMIGTPEAETALIAGFASLGAYPSYAAWYGDHAALIACHASPVHYFIIEALDRMASTGATPILGHLIRSVPTDPDRALLLYNDDYERLTGRVIRRSGHEAAVVEACLAILGDTAETADAKTFALIKDALNVVHPAWAGQPDIENRAAQIVSVVCRDGAYEPRIRAALERYMETSVSIPRVFNGNAQRTPLPVKNWVCFFLARSLGNLKGEASMDVLLSALERPPEAATGVPDPTGPGVLFLHNALTPCWRAACAWALGEIGHKRAIPILIATIEDLTNAPDTRYAAATALAELVDSTSLPAIKALAQDYPEVSTRQALLSISE